WQDQDFLDRCCVGFDADHMPADAKTNENFKDHVLGAYDGIPRTPEWASEICGASPDVIRSLAEQMATTKPLAFKAGQAPARTYYGNRFAQLFLTLGWMMGCVGVLGGEVAAGGGNGTSHFGGPAKSMVKFGSSGYKYPPNPICTEARTGGLIAKGKLDPNQEYGLPYSECFKAIVEGEYTLPGKNGEKRACDIKCIYRDNPHNPANQFSGGNYVEEAYRKVEFVLVHDFMFSTDAKLADIVLPVATTLEQEISAANNLARVCPHDFALVGSKVMEPYFESKADMEIIYLLADKMGISEEVLPRMSIKQGEFNTVATATVVKENGTDYEPLVTIAQSDLDLYQVEGAPQEGRIPLQEFLDKGTYYVERKDGDALMNCFGKAFREDPENNPVETTSGKYEIYCQALEDYYKFIGLSDIDALPKYKSAYDGYEQTRSDGAYPLQLVTIHHIRQAHSIFSNNRQVNEVFANDLLMSDYDAKKLGLAKGDWVQVSSSAGKIARRLNPVPNVMPGVVVLGQG
ncbi:MAG: molybdopterin-dependent oxidoreductase, partial [Gordonibacter sp.]|uniref:molybdopterin dinucleotide binding domain-containing protein n=1 Tax=Gordonibacter sp. TaxID=1968902 RepID=UPI002FC60A82